ncbi:MAG TPA: hypothetical protein VD905_02150, partial [Flavobacteriales bacterium]|nr:hypothetical protein [Flavobacteriales bacterium]
VCAYSLQAQTIIKSAENKVLGYIEDGNKFYDLNSAKILDFSTDGSIKDLGGDVMATYNRETGQVLDKNGDLIYTVDGSNIKSPSNSVIAAVSGNNLNDGDAHLIGSAASIDKYYISFFFLVYNKL